MNRILNVVVAFLLMMVFMDSCKTSRNMMIENCKSKSVLGLPRNICTLVLPATDAIECTELPLLSKDVYLARPFCQKEPERLIVVDGEIVDISALKTEMGKWRSECNKADIPLLSCRLSIDKSLKMKYVDEVMRVLVDVSINRFQYAVVSRNVEVDIQDYAFLSLHTMRVQARFRGDSIYQKWFADAKEIHNQINVCQIASDSYSINGALAKSEDCKALLKSLIQQDLDYIVCLKVNDDMLYGDYMVIVTSLMEAVEELKDEYAVEKYSKHLNQIISEEEIKEILDHLPLRFFEESETMLQQ